ncbi:hypothetical protein M6B22_13390 [Jatrophihabitans cynanchi]|uniref:Integrase SAM-like N-terminal domain-containing protein n=1 Tax=Jatrophihabitans cynanchi TaxID=2944128 RepID=A0ABY7JT60_9ACTN|nr:hypothetical protein [Jatrophihabitans sp. SB3-54]WAX55534.1 hypothetical protein M6B22_13390 [Jatrophihabitans sp. SB3-54]
MEAADLANVRVSRLPAPHGRDPADTTAADAVEAPGLTREIGTVDVYELVRAWAAWFDQQRRGDVQYSARHTTALTSLPFAGSGKSRHPHDQAGASRVTSAVWSGARARNFGLTHRNFAVR